MFCRFAKINNFLYFLNNSITKKFSCKLKSCPSTDIPPFPICTGAAIQERINSHIIPLRPLLKNQVQVRWKIFKPQQTDSDTAPHKIRPYPAAPRDFPAR